MLGNTVNTNASWIASRVTTLGGNVTRITTVADNLEEISQALREAIRRRPAFIITTGGIGPTFDDMTMHGVAKGLRVRLRLDRAAVIMIREHYARGFPKSHIELTKPRLKMARLPFGAVAIRNPIGTAPGARLNVRRDRNILPARCAPRSKSNLQRNHLFFNRRKSAWIDVL